MHTYLSLIIVQDHHILYSYPCHWLKGNAQHKNLKLKTEPGEAEL